MDQPAFEDISTGPEWLVIRAELVGLPPDRAWRAWTEADELIRWWPQEAELDVVEGGSYHLAWPQMDWHLRGRYLAVEPERTLSFTWAWDHEPETPERTVTVEFAPLSGRDGTELTITHGPYGDSPADAEDRQGHIDGWRQFLGRLAELRPGDREDQEGQVIGT